MDLHDRLILIDGGKTGYRIVTGKDAALPVIHAGKELQYFLRQVTGVEVPMVEDTAEMGPCEIIVGENSHSRLLGIDPEKEDLGEEGYIIRTIGGHLVIAGAKPRGTLYGVYSFLEDYAGCRWFTPKVSHIPEKPQLLVPEIDRKKVPALEYREVYYTDALDGDWAARNKLNGHFHLLDARHGGSIQYTGFVHTFDSLVPVADYFDEHPEYFSEVDGRRLSQRTQLCLTNPEVLDISLRKVRKWIEENPGTRIVSVSQNDWYNPCQCETCRAMDEKEGSHSGTLLYFVNTIAEDIAKDHPEVSIDTLAYQYTRKPPEHIRPAKNVIIRLCSIECCFAHPLGECDEVSYPFKDKVEAGVSFAEDIRAWAKICDRLYIWDYVTNFSNYIMPFPNFSVLQKNIGFFTANSVTGIFEEGNYAKGGGGEFAELRAYVLAKLLWDPDYEMDQAIDEFLGAFYGKASPSIRKYFDLLHRHMKAGNWHLGIYDPPTSKFLDGTVMEEAEALFDEAENAAEDGEILQRVRIARLPVEYVKLSRLPLTHPGRTSLIDDFIRKLSAFGIDEIREGRSLSTSAEQMKSGL